MTVISLSLRLESFVLGRLLFYKDFPCCPDLLFLFWSTTTYYLVLLLCSRIQRVLHGEHLHGSKIRVKGERVWIFTETSWRWLTLTVREEIERGMEYWCNRLKLVWSKAGGRRDCEVKDPKESWLAAMVWTLLGERNPINFEGIEYEASWAMFKWGWDWSGSEQGVSSRTKLEYCGKEAAEVGDSFVF